MGIAFVAFVLRWIADLTCSPYSHVCRKSSEFLSEVYAVVIIFLLIVGATKAKQVQEVFGRVKAALLVLTSDMKQKAD